MIYKASYILGLCVCMCTEYFLCVYGVLLAFVHVSIGICIRRLYTCILPNLQSAPMCVCVCACVCVVCVCVCVCVCV